ncbi:MAG: hypothetical protein M3Q56_00220 [Bacteroidota bacterium]|nr:hypothetical protein [Bacteroidota bacterium]
MNDTFEKVNGEHSLIMLVYNINLSINIVGVPALIEKLKYWTSEFKKKLYPCFNAQILN